MKHSWPSLKFIWHDKIEESHKEPVRDISLWADFKPEPAKYMAGMTHT
jgi:hypothetical protein